MYAASLGKTFEQTQVMHILEKEEAQRKPDVFVSAGTIPIMKIMNNNAGGNSTNQQRQQQHRFEQWLVKFASSEMVIAYSPSSHFHLDLDKVKNGQMQWYQVLSQSGFKFGRTDPKLDPKGYYMIIAANLANIYYNNQNIKQKILGQDDRNPKQIFPEETLTTNLETGQLDAIAAYTHEAIAKGLKLTRIF